MFEKLLDQPLPEVRQRIVNISAGFYRRDDLAWQLAKPCEEVAQSLAGLNSWRQVGKRKRRKIKDVIFGLQIVFGEEGATKLLLTGT